MPRKKRRLTMKAAGGVFRATGQDVDYTLDCTQGRHLSLSAQAGSVAFSGQVATLTKAGGVLPGFYAATNGTSGGDGSVDDPWDLQTAFFGGPTGEEVQPGDTVWMRGGTYTEGYEHGIFWLGVIGTEADPIIFRAYPGEQPIIDTNTGETYGSCEYGVKIHSPREGPAVAHADWVWIWGLEVMNSNTTRWNPTMGIPDFSNPPDARDSGFQILGANVKIINCIIHDTGDNLFIGANSNGDTGGVCDMEIVGCITYYCGWQNLRNPIDNPTPPENADGRNQGRHGTSAYMQSYGGAKLFHNNIAFDSNWQGMRCYGTSGASALNFWMYNNASLQEDMQLGGKTGFDLTGAKMNANLVVGRSADIESRGMLSPGYLSEDLGMECNNNFCWGVYVDVNHRGFEFGPPSKQEFWNLMTMTGNLFYGYVGNGLDSAVIAQWPDNTWAINGRPGAPTSNQVWIYDDPYEENRGVVYISNVENLSSVSVDVSGLLEIGVPFEVRDAQNWPGDPVVTGTYDGDPVSIPMTGLTKAPYVGHNLTQSELAAMGYPNRGAITNRPSAHSCESKHAAFVVRRTY